MYMLEIVSRATMYSGIVIISLLSSASMAADDVESLGTLFTDSEQREKLEAVRRGTYLEEAEKNSRVSNIRVDGIMLRGDGHNVVWVNGSSTLEGGPVEGIRVSPEAINKDNNKVPVTIEGKRVYVKPGQIWSEGTGQVTDNY
jgi:hypothetical protein